MGPKSKFQDVELKEGTQVKLLVRPGRINGEDAMIAQEVNVDGKTVKLPRPRKRTRFPGDRGKRDQRDGDRDADRPSNGNRNRDQRG